MYHKKKGRNKVGLELRRNAKTQGLPSTPYYKMIDYWLLFTMNIMVYTLAFHTFLQV